VAGFEILEHTADVGIRAWGASLEEAFEQAGWGLADILGAVAESPGGRLREVAFESADEGGLLVDFLNELLLLHETEECAFARIRIRRLEGGSGTAEVDVVPVAGELEGVGVKAATYHQLRVERRQDGATLVEVYLDV
jgi:SHS2 domain-containing protein